MKRIYKLIIILIISSTVQTYEDSGESTDENNSKIDEENGRSTVPFPQNPLIDLLFKKPDNNCTPRYPADIIDILRDPYPLPGGLKAPFTEYDFVIVGAGSAGSVLASRLTEDRNTTVLLLEAGKPEMMLTAIPALAPYFQSTDYSWQYFTEPQANVCIGMINQRCFWPRGKAVGGTSIINYMVYTRGRPKDWNRIAEDGNYGWSYNDVLKYYMKSEKADLKGFEKKLYRNSNGELPVEFPPIKTPLVDAFLEAGRILGHPTIDYNAPNELGFGQVQATISNGRRQSASKVFLHPHKIRPNLHILPETTATKILINPTTKMAFGVEYVRNKLKNYVKVRKEVIISAGPIASPQLLMLSGIGPQTHLSSLGIPVIQDSPVGRTLYDHISFPGLIFTLNATDVSFSESKVLKIKTIIDWIRYGKNGLSSPGAVEGIGYIKTSVSNDSESVPDIELISMGGSFLSDGGPDGSKSVRRGMRIKEQVFNNAFGAVDNTDSWTAFPMLIHPKSVGYLELKDNNPFSHPRIYNNYLTEPDDVATLIEAIRHVQALAATKPFQKFGARFHRAEYAQCVQHIFDSDAYWECALRTLTVTLHHQIATCRMGPAGDLRAVVDPELRVHGITNLRVVDSSVIPRTISAHTNAPAIMIGEKAADMIKNTWK